MTIPGGPTGGPFGANKLVYHDEFVAGQIGQVGTQFDGFGHIGIQRGADGERSLKNAALADTVRFVVGQPAWRTAQIPRERLRGECG